MEHYSFITPIENVNDVTFKIINVTFFIRKENKFVR